MWLLYFIDHEPAAHIAALYFDGRKEMAKKRVQKLKAAGLIRERPRRLTEPSILFLARKAFEFLRDAGHLSSFPALAIAQFEKRARVSALTIRHELQVMDVKTAMTTAVNKTDRFCVAEFSTWPLLYQFKACEPDGERVLVKPDGFIRVEEKEADGGASEHTFFLEVDRSTEALDVLADRCHCYLDFYRSGGLAVRNGKTADQYMQFPFRVLVVCKSQERRDNVARRLLVNNPPILTLVWLTTFTQFTQHAFDSIWVVPGAYRPPTSQRLDQPHTAIPGMSALFEDR